MMLLNLHALSEFTDEKLCRLSTFVEAAGGSTDMLQWLKVYAKNVATSAGCNVPSASPSVSGPFPSEPKADDQPIWIKVFEGTPARTEVVPVRRTGASLTAKALAASERAIGYLDAALAAFAQWRSTQETIEDLARISERNVCEAMEAAMAQHRSAACCMVEAAAPREVDSMLAKALDHVDDVFMAWHVDAAVHILSDARKATQDALMYILCDGVEETTHFDSKIIKPLLKEKCRKAFGRKVDGEAAYSRLLNTHYQLFIRPASDIDDKKATKGSNSTQFSSTQGAPEAASAASAVFVSSSSEETAQAARPASKIKVKNSFIDVDESDAGSLRKYPASCSGRFAQPTNFSIQLARASHSVLPHISALAPRKQVEEILDKLSQDNKLPDYGGENGLRIMDALLAALPDMRVASVVGNFLELVKVPESEGMPHLELSVDNTMELIEQTSRIAVRFGIADADELALLQCIHALGALAAKPIAAAAAFTALLKLIKSSPSPAVHSACLKACLRICRHQKMMLGASTCHDESILSPSILNRVKPAIRTLLANSSDCSVLAHQLLAHVQPLSELLETLGSLEVFHNVLTYVYNELANALQIDWSGVADKAAMSLDEQETQRLLKKLAKEHAGMNDLSHWCKSLSSLEPWIRGNLGEHDSKEYAGRYEMQKRFKLIGLLLGGQAVTELLHSSSIHQNYSNGNGQNHLYDEHFLTAALRASSELWLLNVLETIEASTIVATVMNPNFSPEKLHCISACMGILGYEGMVAAKENSAKVKLILDTAKYWLRNSRKPWLIASMIHECLWSLVKIFESADPHLQDHLIQECSCLAKDVINHRYFRKFQPEAQGYCDESDDNLVIKYAMKLQEKLD
jgi:hypothetical protein